MDVKKLTEILGAKVLAGAAGMEKSITGCYTGDLLSWVMGRAKSGDVWPTVMGNVNAVAVAALTDAACIVLTDNASLDEEARVKAEEQQIAVLSVPQNSYEVCVKIAENLEK
jgi:predicted transcriptional regulator